jgi:U3 small nucleolar RNA-associated protein 19
MLAHRVGQYYGLATNTVDYEESTVRVVGVRTEFSKDPRVRHRLWLA